MRTRKLSFVCPSPELSLQTVRELNEHAVNRPWDRTLHCIPVKRMGHAARGEVFHPWTAGKRDELREKFEREASILANERAGWTHSRSEISHSGHRMGMRTLAEFL